MRTFLIIALFFCISTNRVYAITLFNNDSIRISIFTCGPGDDLYSKFGHTAIRVRNESVDDDIVFNYGMFNYNSENFIWRFILGDTDYELGAEITTSFISRYKKEGIAMNEQVLNITNDEAKALLRSLMVNYMPMNRVYRYDFLYDNCTTRAKDIIETSFVDGTVVYDISSSDSLVTYREMLHDCLKDIPWIRLGIDCLLGAEVDRVPEKNKSIFLPGVLMNAIDNSYIKYKDGLCKKLILSNNSIIKNKIKDNLNFDFSFNSFLHPVFVFTCLFLISVFLMTFELKKGVVFWIYDIFVMLLLGLSGLIVSFLFFFSKHPAVDSNWLVIPLNPLYIVWIPFLIYNNMWEKRSVLHKVSLVVLTSFVILLPFIPQDINISVVLLVLTMIVRDISNILVAGRIPNVYYEYNTKIS